MNICIIIPAYNEAVALNSLLSRLKNFFTLVVDDGSTDDTFKVASFAASAVLRNDINRGKGAALRKGIAHILSRGDFDYILFMDADGQHCVEDIPLFLAKAEDGYEFILGNRMHDHKKMPLVRYLTNRLMSWFISIMTRSDIPDSQCGFRMISCELLRKIDLVTDRFEIESEMLFKAADLRMSIHSVNIRTIYSLDAHSHIRPWRDTLRFISFIFRSGIIKKKKR